LDRRYRAGCGCESLPEGPPSVVPEKGKALTALAAKSLGVSKSAIDLVSSDTSRKKILRIEAEPEDVINKRKLCSARNQAPIADRTLGLLMPTPVWPPPALKPFFIPVLIIGMNEIEAC
jgi:hypothetical protein